MSKGSRSVKCHRWQPHDVSVTYSCCKSTPWSRCYCWTISLIVCGGCRLHWLAHPERSHSGTSQAVGSEHSEIAHPDAFYFEGEHPLFPVCVTLLVSLTSRYMLPWQPVVTKVSPDLKQPTRYEPGSVRASDAADADQGEGPAQVGGVMVRSDFGWCSYRQTGKSQELVS